MFLRGSATVHIYAEDEARCVLVCRLEAARASVRSEASGYGIAQEE